MHTDAEFLGLERRDGPGRFHFVVADRLTRLDGRLYGGTAIAVSVTAAEQTSERSALWMTTQFVSSVAEGDEVEVLVEVLAPGKRTNQVRVTGTSSEGEVVFASLGATGHHRDGGLSGEFEHCPTVGPPSEATRWDSPFAGLMRAAGIDLDLPEVPMDKGFNAVVELREPKVVHHPDHGPGRMCLWIRRRDRQEITPAMASYLADVVPMSIANACGVAAGGTSLDNSIRIGSFVPSEWILLDLRPHLAVGDYGHGAVHIWSEEGHLMATASQTASMFRIDEMKLRWATGGK